MLNFFQTAIFLVLGMGLNNPDDCFYDKVLSSLANNYYLAFSIKLDNVKEDIVIRNLDCFVYFHKEYSLTFAEYVDTMNIVLTKNIILDFSDMDLLKEYSFEMITDELHFPPIQLYDKAKFLSIYFGVNGILREEYSQYEYIIIKYLFDWRIPIQVDDETGFLIIDL